MHIASNGWKSEDFEKSRGSSSPLDGTSAEDSSRSGTVIAGDLEYEGQSVAVGPLASTTAFTHSTGNERGSSSAGGTPVSRADLDAVRRQIGQERLLLYGT